ncbi:MAG: bifunctional 4-hydroxy-3-methylbut-2-enyl diphosphate reductase/30S ribosomal protein S1, partial [Clostridia bacterium]|nr:bifunctional 4-hydroxy-3-methylbut-2-enyl diphosphate reductase/30S ribosomal protein S1 [Clostridia bacterium]
MKFLFPKNIGFCKGVQNAINKALAVDGKAYCLGDIVHNKSVIERLKQKGIETVNSIDDVPQGATMIIRAHGVPPIVYEQAKARNIQVVDATCPSVRAIQQKAQKYYNDGYQIVLVGDANHPEIIGINGWCNNSALIFDGKGILDLKGHEKVLVMFQ